MIKKKVLLLCGGGSTEHDVSLVSVKHIEDCLKDFPDFEVTSIELDKSGEALGNIDLKAFDVAIPCIHGYPGETGDLLSYFEMAHIPYLGCNSETSKICFNKITTKLWATALGVPNTPFVFLSENNQQAIQTTREFQEEHGDVVIKASNQGSSVGCYMVEKNNDPEATVKKAFGYSPFVLIEKRMKPRELEVSAYEFEGKVHISYPGEIICPSQFYSFEEKYSAGSITTTEVRAKDLTDKTVSQITDYSTKLFHGLKLRHLSRIDFFLDNGEVYLNEINTFPGLTPISMFPKMMEANGHSFKDFLREQIQLLTK